MRFTLLAIILVSGFICACKNQDSKSENNSDSAQDSLSVENLKIGIDNSALDRNVNEVGTSDEENWWEKASHSCGATERARFERTLEALKGSWASREGVICKCVIHRDWEYIEFLRGNTWSELDGRKFVVGSEMKFMIKDHLYIIKIGDSDRYNVHDISLIKHNYKRDVYVAKFPKMVKVEE